MADPFWLSMFTRSCCIPMAGPWQRPMMVWARSAVITRPRRGDGRYRRCAVNWRFESGDREEPAGLDDMAFRAPGDGVAILRYRLSESIRPLVVHPEAAQPSFDVTVHAGELRWKVPRGGVKRRPDGTTRVTCVNRCPRALHFEIGQGVERGGEWKSTGFPAARQGFHPYHGVLRLPNDTPPLMVADPPAQFSSPPPRELGGVRRRGFI